MADPNESDEPPEAKKWINAGKFLTDNEIQCLSGQEVKRGSQTRYHIRYKALGALDDLFTVNSGLSNKDARKMFEGTGNITTKGTTRDSPEGDRDVLPGREGELSSIIALACRGYERNGIEPEEFVSKVVVPGIRKGVGDANDIHPKRVSVDIQADITPYDDMSKLADRLEQEGPESLTEREAYLLYQYDKITLEKFTSVLEEINE